MARGNDRDALFQVIEDGRDDLIALVRELVRIPSTLGREGPVQRLVADRMRATGMSVDLWNLSPGELAGVPGYAPVEGSFDDHPNVVGVLRGRGGGRSLILNGHADVISAEPLAGWERDPWAAEIADGRMYGRGALDMKGGLAVALYLVDCLGRAGVRLAGDLTLESVIEEECSGNGTLAACARGYRADAAILLEPTRMRASVASMGLLWFRVVIQGRPVPASVASTGVNPILKMYHVIASLQELEREMNRVGHPTYEGIEHPVNLNVGAIRGGIWPEMVPADCTADCRLGFFPGQRIDEVRAAVEEAVAGAARSDPFLQENPPRVLYTGFRCEGSTISPDSELISALGASHRRVTGRTLEYRRGTGCNDMRYFNLYYNIPATCYGPEGENLHAPNECLYLDSLIPTCRVMGDFVLDWCGS